MSSLNRLMQANVAELEPAERAGAMSKNYSSREELFRETPYDWAKRVVLGTAWSLKPSNIGSVPGLTKLWLKDQAGQLPPIPDPRSGEQAGIVVGIARDLSVPTLIAAAKQGIYPLGHVGHPKWCSPETRAVLFFDDFHISKSARRVMRKGQYRVTFDQAFEEVIMACSEPRPGHWHVNWITPAMKHAYARLFDAGYAHSIEVWDENGELKGGGYGVAIGQVFIGESLFSRERDTSKIAVAVLMRHLVEWGYCFVDTKLMNPLMESFGFREIPRDRFLFMNEKAMSKPGRSGRWEIEFATAEVAGWQVNRSSEPEQKKASA